MVRNGYKSDLRAALHEGPLWIKEIPACRLKFSVHSQIAAPMLLTAGQAQNRLQSSHVFIIRFLREYNRCQLSAHYEKKPLGSLS